MDEITIHPDDLKKVLESNPVVMLQAKLMSLIRLLEEKDAEIARLNELLNPSNGKDDNALKKLEGRLSTFQSEAP